MLVISNDVTVRATLKDQLLAYEYIEVTSESGDSIQAIKEIDTHKPHFIVLDTELPGFNSSDVIHAIYLQPPPFIIFLSTSEQFAFRAFEFNAIDYLLKPISKTRLDQTLEKIARISGCIDQYHAGSVQRILGFYSNAAMFGKYRERFLIKEKRKYFFVHASDISYIESSGDYTFIYKGNAKHILYERISDVETGLNPALFARIHRSIIVNASHIDFLQPHANREFFIMLKNGQRLKVSRNYRDNLSRLLPEL